MDNLLVLFCLQLQLITSQVAGSSLGPSDLVIVILSQSGPYHSAKAELSRKDIELQSGLMERDPPEVIITHELRIPGSWTIFPLLPYLSSHYPNGKWFLFCSENTVINLPELVKVLSENNFGKSLWISHGLSDRDFSIIHHFTKREDPFKYPSEASGFAMTRQFLHRLVNGKPVGGGLKAGVDFSIDPFHELAAYVADDVNGPSLIHSSKFCIVPNRGCATYPRQFQPCDIPVPREKIYVAVKTCQKFRKDRIPVILKTWSKYAINIGFYTDEADGSLKNAHVVPKTDSGHCAKTRGILKHALEKMNARKIDWLLIADDDTILSLSRMQKLLSCYRAENWIALGQRYGFQINKFDGYDYLTSGAGLVLSRSLVELLVKSKDCQCPHRQTADDMFLFGRCLKSLGVTITHSPAFHQARPIDYASAYLASHEPVSFHSFWNINPEDVYRIWFAEDDRKFFQSRTHNTDEL